MTIHRRFLTGFLLAFMATSVWAQSWPTRPVRMIIAFPPGGPTDLVSRVLAQRLSEQLGQQVIVDNKPGAGGNLAAELAARATPDGYTIFYNTSAIVIGPALYGKVNYDTLKDFAPVALTASVPMVLVVNPQLPARNVKEFLDLAKSRPGALNYSSSGTGTITHLASAMMSSQTGVQTQHIPYKGSAPGLVDLAAGQTQFMIDTINTVLPYVRDNRLRGFDAAAWQGIVVPTGTPADIVQKLNTEVNKALAHPDLRARLAAQGAEILGGTPAEYAAHLRTEIPRWAKAVKDSGAKAE
jgi:tripartite-type tricarboxylate transporter receptor subunit TctC